MFRLLFVTFFGTYRGDVDPSDLGIRHPELAGTPDANGEHETHHHPPAWIMSGTGRNSDRADDRLPAG